MKSILRILILMSISRLFSASPAELITWKIDTGKSITASPVIRGDMLYFGSTNHLFYAVHRLTGEITWQFDTGSPVRSNAAVLDGGICFESGDQVFLLDFDGNPVWQVPLHEEKGPDAYDSWDYFHASPVIAAQTVYIGTGAGHVVGLNVQTGAEEFRCITGTDWGIRIPPVIYRGTILFGDWDGVFYAYSLDDGEPVWSYDTKNDYAHPWQNAIQTPPVIQNDILYFSGRCSVVYALNPEDGTVIWKWHSPTDQWIVGGPVIDGDILYIGSSDQHLFYGLNIETGMPVFETELDFRVFGGAALGTENAYAGSGSLYALNKRTGEITGRLPMPRDIIARPVLHEQTLYFGCGDGSFFAVNEPAFNTLSYPETVTDDRETIDLGFVSGGSQPVVILPLWNLGEGDDSIAVTLSGASRLKKAWTVNQEHFTLKAGDSTTIVLQLNPESLKYQVYELPVTLKSVYNLENNELKKTIRMTLIEPAGVEGGEPVPGAFRIEGNYPNPFNPGTRLSYFLPEVSPVRLTVLDNLGRFTASWTFDSQPAGVHSVFFDGKSLASGLYLALLETGSVSVRHKMLLIK